MECAGGGGEQETMSRGKWLKNWTCLGWRNGDFRKSSTILLRMKVVQLYIELNILTTKLFKNEWGCFVR